MPIVKDTIKSASGEDVTIYMEVDSLSTDSANPWGNTRGIADQAPKAVDAFQKATTLIHACVENIAESILTVPEKIKPQAFEAQFSVKFSTEWGAVLAKSGLEGQIQITLKWGEQDE